MPLKFEALGFDLFLYGPNIPIDEQLRQRYFREWEPRIVFNHRSKGTLTPRERTKLYFVTQAVAEEMKEVRKVRVEKEPFYAFVFPREFYAENPGSYFVPL